MLFLGIVLWAVVFFVSNTNVTYQLKEKSTYLNNEGSLLSYLMSPVDQGNIADLIIMAYNGESKTMLITELGPIINKVYGKAGDVCWKVWYYTEDNDKTLLAGTECGKKTDFFDAETIIPTLNNKKLRIRLNIPGYKK